MDMLRTWDVLSEFDSTGQFSQPEQTLQGQLNVKCLWEDRAFHHSLLPAEQDKVDGFYFQSLYLHFISYLKSCTAKRSPSSRTHAISMLSTSCHINLPEMSSIRLIHQQGLGFRCFPVSPDTSNDDNLKYYTKAAFQILTYARHLSTPAIRLSLTPNRNAFFRQFCATAVSSVYMTTDSFLSWSQSQTWEFVAENRSLDKRSGVWAHHVYMT